MKLYLASTSPRRYDLLKTLNIPFEVIAPTFEEISTPLPPAEEAIYLATEKAKSVRDRCPRALILASDTLVACGDEKLGKPKDGADALGILKKLSGKTHSVFTAVVLLNTSDNSLRQQVEGVHVTFKNLSEDDIKNYIATGEPFGKAGAYAIQGRAKMFITKVEGNVEAAIGLPLAPLRTWLLSK